MIKEIILLILIIISLIDNIRLRIKQNKLKKILGHSRRTDIALYSMSNIKEKDIKR